MRPPHILYSPLIFLSYVEVFYGRCKCMPSLFSKNNTMIKMALDKDGEGIDGYFALLLTTA